MQSCYPPAREEEAEKKINDTRSAHDFWRIMHHECLYLSHMYHHATHPFASVHTSAASRDTQCTCQVCEASVCQGLPECISTVSAVLTLSTESSFRDTRPSGQKSRDAVRRTLFKSSSQ